MHIRSLLLFALLATGACAREPAADQTAAGDNSGAMVNRADDAPGNAATAPVPISGSGEVPPNAPTVASGDNPMENGTAAH